MTLVGNAARKALRLFTAGRVREIEAPRVFVVCGDHGQRLVVRTDLGAFCTCPASGAECSHILATDLLIERGPAADHLPIGATPSEAKP